MNKSNKTYSINDIKKILSSHESALKAKYKTMRFYLFGSYARGDATSNSDIDLLVEFSETIDMFDFVALQNYLKEIFGKDVDLGTPKSLKSFVKDKILKEAIVI